MPMILLTVYLPSIVVLPTDMLNGAALTKETIGAKVVSAVKTLSSGAGYYHFTLCLTNMPTDCFERDFTVRPYFTKTDSLGHTRTVYGDAWNTPLAEIANSVPESNRYYAVINENILSKIK